MTSTDRRTIKGHRMQPACVIVKDKASELFAKPPSIDKIDVLAAKLPK